MNQNQHYLLDKHNLSVEMLFALSSLVEGNKMRFYGRSYKALQRRGLVADGEALTVTESGSAMYQSYCNLGESPQEQLEAHRQDFDSIVLQQEKQTICPTCGQYIYGEYPTSQLTSQSPSSDPPISELTAANMLDNDLEIVIDSWKSIPIEFRKLITDAATRIASR